MRPAAGVVALAREVIDAGDVGHVRRREGAHRTDQELGGGAHAGAGLHRPALRRFVVAGVLHPGLELDVAAEVEPIGDMFEVGQHGGLLGLGLVPVPLLHELIGEGVAVEGAARTIDACAGVTVVPPGATDVAGTVVHAHREAHLAKMVQGVHAADSHPDDHHVVVLDRSAHSRRLIAARHPSLLRTTRIDTPCGEPVVRDRTVREHCVLSRLVPIDSVSASPDQDGGGCSLVRTRLWGSIPDLQGEYREFGWIRGYREASRDRKTLVSGRLSRDFPGPWNRERRPGEQGASRQGQGSPRGLFQGPWAPSRLRPPPSSRAGYRCSPETRFGSRASPGGANGTASADPAGGTASVRSR